MTINIFIIIFFDKRPCLCMYVSSDKKPLEIDARMNMIACPDGRQLLMIMQTTKKDVGVYECVATNPLASVSSSCTISLARKNWDTPHFYVRL